MVRVIVRKCTEGMFAVNEEDKKIKVLKKGKEYETSRDLEDGTCMVIHKYWFKAPISKFIKTGEVISEN